MDVLHALADHYDEMLKSGKAAKFRRSIAGISFLVMLDRDGYISEIKDIRRKLTSAKGKELSFPIDIEVPEKVERTSGVVANFLYDMLPYFMEHDKKKNEKCEAFKVRNETILKDVNTEMAERIKKYFQHEEDNQNKFLEMFGEDTKKIDGCYLMFANADDGKFVADREILDAYDRSRDEKDASSLCVDTGANEPYRNLHASIKGIDNTASGGAKLISFNAESFCSYGKTSDDQGGNAPVSRLVAFKYAEAISSMMSDRSTNVINIDGMMVFFWTKGASNDNCDAVFDFLVSGTDNIPFEDTDLKVFVKNTVTNGICSDDFISKNYDRDFYILGIKGNSGRLAISFFFENSFGKIMENINAHNKNLEIDGYCPNISRIIEETGRKSTKEDKGSNAVSKVLQAALLQAVISGGKYPEALYLNIIKRIRIERNVNKAKACVIKAYMLKNRKMEDFMCNEEKQSTAFLYGRLFRIIEDAQRCAIGNTNTTIKDKYLAAAATSPARVFPIIMRKSSNYLQKLRSNNPAAYVAKSKEISSIMSLIEENGATSFKARHNLYEEGEFYLGYFKEDSLIFKDIENAKKNKTPDKTEE